jgi:hypothetical protein
MIMGLSMATSLMGQLATGMSIVDQHGVLGWPIRLGRVACVMSVIGGSNEHRWEDATASLALVVGNADFTRWDRRER